MLRFTLTTQPKIPLTLGHCREHRVPLATGEMEHGKLGDYQKLDEASSVLEAGSLRSRQVLCLGRASGSKMPPSLPW